MKIFYFLPLIVFLAFSCESTKNEKENPEENAITEVQPNDLLVQYYDGGQPKYSQEFINGIKHGEYKHWFKEGKVHTSGQYYMGMRNGTWQWYDEKGEMTLEVNYGNSLARL